MFRPSPPTSCRWPWVLSSSMSPWIHRHRTLRLLWLHLQALASSRRHYCSAVLKPGPYVTFLLGILFGSLPTETQPLLYAYWVGPIHLRIATWLTTSLLLWSLGRSLDKRGQTRLFPCLGRPPLRRGTPLSQRLALCLEPLTVERPTRVRIFEDFRQSVAGVGGLAMRPASALPARPAGLHVAE